MKQNRIFEITQDINRIVIPLVLDLHQSKREFSITIQFLRSSTSIGANAHEAKFAKSKADFIHKLALARKECSEAIYWLDCLKIGSLITLEQQTTIETKLTEAFKILNSSIKTARSNSLKN